MTRIRAALNNIVEIECGSYKKLGEGTSQINLQLLPEAKKEGVDFEAKPSTEAKIKDNTLACCKMLREHDEKAAEEGPGKKQHASAKKEKRNL